jgi:hypothetical protein
MLDPRFSGFIEPLVENDRGIAGRCRERRARLNSKTGFGRRVVKKCARSRLGGVVLTEKEVLDRLAEAAVPMPRTRFENWREHGLVVPCGPRKGLGQAKGRRTHLYPDGTIEQAIEIARLLRQNLDLDEIGWRLWLSGLPVGRNCWFDVFVAAAKEFDEAAATSREALNSDSLNEDPIQELADKAYSADMSDPIFRQARKALGPDRLEMVLFHLMSMMIGEFTSVSTQIEQLSKDDDTSVSAQMDDPKIKERQAELRTMDVALGFIHARSDTVAGVGPIISGDYSSILRETFAPLADTNLNEFLRSVDPERLRTVTRDLSALIQSIAVASEEFGKTLAKDAFGLGRAALAARSDRKRQAGMGLIWTLVQERSAQKFHDLSGMAQSFNAAALAVRQSAQSGKWEDGSNAPIFRRGPTRKPIK